MDRSFLDAFQFIVAGYLFYTVIKGSGTLYNFPDVPAAKKKSVHKNLRRFYLAGAVIALLDGLAAVLQNQMFTVNYTETGSVITQNFSIPWLPFLTYQMLSTFSLVCTVLFVALLIGVMVYVKKQ